MSAIKQGAPTKTYCAREVVATFGSAEALEAAVDKLELAGLDRSTLSVLGTNPKDKLWLEQRYGSTVKAADSSRAERSAFVSTDSKAEGTGAAITAPLYIASVAGAFAVIASGGTLALAAGVAIAAGAAGGGLGALVANVVGSQHAENVMEQIARGGLVLWVSVADPESEQRVLALLRECGGQHVHVHEVERRFGAEARPLSGVQPDPFLESDR